METLLQHPLGPKDSAAASLHTSVAQAYTHSELPKTASAQLRAVEAQPQQCSEAYWSAGQALKEAVSFPIRERQEPAFAPSGSRCLTAKEQPHGTWSLSESRPVQSESPASSSCSSEATSLSFSSPASSIASTESYESSARRQQQTHVCRARAVLPGQKGWEGGLGSVHRRHPCLREAQCKGKAGQQRARKPATVRAPQLSFVDEEQLDVLLRAVNTGSVTAQVVLPSQNSHSQRNLIIPGMGRWHSRAGECIDVVMV